MNSAQFDTLEQAIDHAKKLGGWIYASNCGTVAKWYDAAKWSFTTITRDNAGTSGLVAAWSEHQQKLSEVKVNG